MRIVQEFILPHFNYWIYVVLMMTGLYAMIAKRNLIKKLIGMSIFQTAIILCYVSIGVKEGATIPILEHEPAHAVRDGHGARGPDGGAQAGPDPGAIDPAHYANPLPHVLMLTAIVVGVSTLGVGLALAQRIYADYGSLEEDEILDSIKPSDD